MYRRNHKIMTRIANTVVRGVFLSLLMAASTGLAAIHSWTNTLSYGWNAVWLEVEPRAADGSLQTADQVFNAAGFNIDRVAVQSEPLGTSEFSTDPTRLYNQSGWIVWSRNPVSGETSTITVRGNMAYLVHVSPKSAGPINGEPAGELILNGNVEFHRPRWNRGNYNLRGFSVQGSPTFESLLRAGITQFLSTPAGSPVKKLDPATGLWLAVGPTDPVERGRAYWSWVPFTLKSADYAGPVAISFPGSQQGRIDFGSTPPSITVTDPLNAPASLSLSPTELTLSSLEPTGGPARTVTLSKVSAADDQELRLFRIVRVPGQLAWQTDPAVGVIQHWALPPLTNGQTTTITLGLDRNWTSGGTFREQLYRLDVSLDGGSVYYYLPVSASNPDVPPTNAPLSNVSSFAGLWVGTVTAETVTSLTSSMREVGKTASRAQLRVLVHVNTNGTPVLLSHVMRMQTKTADSSVSPTEVLVLNETQIPYFEGIEERGGKKVGIRYESVAFDLPRDNRTNAQSSAFLQRAGGTTNLSQVTDAQVSAYLAGLTSRPPDLREVYWDRWPLAGVFGPGNSIGTATNAPLRLDAFHRTNPFRHAYHPQHGAGYDLMRSFTIQLDSTYQPGSSRLTGRYEEAITGLSTTVLVARGSIVLQRASLVDQLQ
jgi:hypothetical protein